MSNKADIASHCRELDRCNQRGGRMLSILDLLDAGTIDTVLGAYLMACITRGASIMVSAGPGGAGKTTVMCALVNLAPLHLPLVAATPEAVRKAHRNPPEGQRCFICHEIGRGAYFAYLWGADLRDYCALSQQGHMLATNLHADDLDEAREQVCGDNGVPLEHFHAFNLLIFLRIIGRFREMRRRVVKVYALDESDSHRLVYDDDQGVARFEPDDWTRACQTFLEKQFAGPNRTIEDVRREVVAFLA